MTQYFLCIIHKAMQTVQYSTLQIEVQCTMYCTLLSQVIISNFSVEKAILWLFNQCMSNISMILMYEFCGDILRFVSYKIRMSCYFGQ